jgi:outer membrane protein OmpU
MATSMTFTGNGELDNGSTFKVTIAHDNKSAYSASAIALTTPSLGTFTYDEGGGTGLDRIDDMMPTAWEETDGAGLPAGLDTVTGAGGSADIEWNVGMGLPDGMNAYISFAPMPGGGQQNTNKGVGGDTGVVIGHGWDIVLSHNALLDGLNVFGGMSEIEQGGGVGDREEYLYGATYAIGGVTLGYQHSREDNAGATGTFYDNDAYGISFSVNDDLTVSYGVHESKSQATGATLSAESLQASYTVGGASIKIAENQVDNVNYTAGTNREGRTIALTLAF